MTVSPLSSASYQASYQSMSSGPKPGAALLEKFTLVDNDAQVDNGAQVDTDAQAVKEAEKEKELRKAFDDFVGQTFYGQMLSAMRETVGKPAYMHGGRAEEVFQKQLDQVMAEKLSDATASTFTGPMYELFKLPRVA
jgi:hypothetical protein